MKHLFDYLTERHEDLLYHFTTGRSLVNILRKDTFVCSVGNLKDPAGYCWYMSTTRTPYGGMGYASAIFSKDVVRICFDGEKLGHNHKIKIVDLLKAKQYAIKNCWENPDEFDTQFDPSQCNVEAEDRILFREPEVKNFHKYIRKIYINHETIDPHDADDILRYCDRHGIDCEVSETTKEFNFSK